MFWNEIDLNYVTVVDDSIYYKDESLRFQVPVGYTADGITEWSRVNIVIDNSEFFEWFTKLENHIGKVEPFDSVASENTLNVKFVEGFSQIYNKEKKIEKSNLCDCTVHVIVDISKKYGPFKERYGLVCKIYQVVFIENGCAFT
jgi:hypothetical protein